MLSSIKKYIKAFISQPNWNRRGNFPYFNQKVYFPKNSAIFLKAMFEGVYEENNVNIIKKLVRDSTTVFDIGANIGLMAIPILDKFPNSTVISVEPSPNSFPFLSKTQNNSKFNERWIVVNKAISNTTGIVNFQLTAAENGAYESILDTKRSPIVDTISVNTTTIDALWIAQQKPEVSFIKIDIEGADLLALMGAKECIKHCKPHLLIEWNKTNIIPFGLNNQNLLNLAEEINYSIFALPHLTICNDLTTLNLLAQLGEDFLLSPNAIEV